MKKLPVLFLFVLVLLALSPSSASAYGGIGFPPGWFGNSHPKLKLVCTQVKRKLPNDREITVPRCKIEKVKPPTEDQTALRKDLKERFKELFSRIRNGNK
jgi:hypothetical protein